jgi:ribosome-associated protein
MDDLRVTDKIVIPADELHWTFSPSGGPGGQHANRTASRAQLQFDLSATAAWDTTTGNRILARLGTRAKDGKITVVVDKSRSQWQNRQAARKRLVEIIRGALRPESRRVATTPGRGARERRLAAKRRRAETKKLRGRPDPDV